MNLFKIKVSKTAILKLFLFICLFCGIILPIIVMLFKIEPSDFNIVFKNDQFFTLLTNSLIYTLITTILVVIISFLSAYFLYTSNIKHKSIFVVLFTIPMLIPSISHGLGITNLFGINGFIDKIFNVEIEAYGLFGLVFASSLYSFPVSFLMFYDNLRYQDNKIFEAAETLGISKLKQIFCLVLPNLKSTIGSAIFSIFTMVFTDYGVPLAIAGDFKTLPVYLYQEVINRLNFSKGIIVAISLLIPAIIAFLYDAIIKKPRQSQISNAILKQSKLFNTISYVICIIISLIIMLPIISFSIMAFVKLFPNDMTPTVEHLKYIYEYGMFNYLANSIIIALFAGILGTISAFLISYLTTRIKDRFSKVLHFITITSLAIPCIVLGLSYIFIFKRTFIYGTIIILVLVNIVHFLASPYLMSKNALEKIDNNYEIVGNTLGISKFKIFLYVIIPNSLLTMIEMFSYFFINSMITISAVSFLASIFDMPLSLLIPTFEAQLSYEAAAIISLVILIVNLLFKLILNTLTNILKKGKLRYAR